MFLIRMEFAVVRGNNFLDTDQGEWLSYVVGMSLNVSG